MACWLDIQVGNLFGTAFLTHSSSFSSARYNDVQNIAVKLIRYRGRNVVVLLTAGSSLWAKLTRTTAVEHLVAACNFSIFRLRVAWGADSGNKNHQNPLYRT